MTMLRYAAGAAILLAAGGTLAARQTSPAPRPMRAAPGDIVVREPAPRYRYDALKTTQALASTYVKSGRIPSITAMIGHGDDRPFEVSAGRIDDAPAARFADPDSLWRVYSMTKPITAMAAMILVEEGRLKLDQPVGDIIPAFRHMRVQVSPASLQTRPATRPITIRHLMTHTAGLGYTIVTRGPLLDAYEKAGIVPFTNDARTEARVRLTRPPTLAAFADRVATLPLIAEPGTRWSYSIGLDVLGAVIERASGMPFDRFLQTRLFDPLKMRSTYFTVPRAEAARLATGYALLGANRIPLDVGASSVYLTPPTFPYGGAGLVTSAADYDRFLHMLQNGGTLERVRVLRPETVRLAMSNLLPPGVIYPGAGSSTGGTTSAQGFGAGGSVSLADVPGGPGKGTYGWGGAAGTIAWVDPANRVRATIMVNYLPGDRWPLRAEFGRTIYADLAPMLRAPRLEPQRR